MGGSGQATGRDGMKQEFKIGLFLGVIILIAAALIFILGDLSVLFKKGGYNVPMGVKRTQ